MPDGPMFLVTSELVDSTINDADHLLRHVKGTQIFNGVVSSAAFQLGEDGGLSFSWVEFFRGEFSECLVSAINEICAARRVRSSHRFAELVVEEIKNKFENTSLPPPQPKHAPVEMISAHAEIDRHYLLNRMAETLLAEVVRNVHAPPQI